MPAKRQAAGRSGMNTDATPPALARRLASLALPAAAGLLAVAALVALLTAAPAQAAATAQTHTFPGPGDCSTLQGCIDAAAVGDTIVVQTGTHPVGITLNKAVSLTGVSSASVILQALPGQRVLTVTGAVVDASVVISGLTFTGGNVSVTTTCPANCGGGILIADGANPLVSHVTISGNAAYRGGGIYSSSARRLNASIVAHNTSGGGDGGGAWVLGTAALNGGRFERNQCLDSECWGGGLRTNGLALTGTQLISNTAGMDGGGVWVNGAATLNGGLFQGNQCNHNNCTGGGLRTESALALTGTQFISNTSRSHGGGAFAFGAAALNGGLFQGNQCAQDSCMGGGLRANGTLALTGTQFISNTARWRGGGASAAGGAALNGGLFQGNKCTHGLCLGGGLAALSANITGTEFIGNEAGSSAGAATAQNITVTGARFIGNAAEEGGALRLDHGGQVINTLFAGNQANSNRGAAIFIAATADASLLHNTVTSATLASGSAIYAEGGSVTALNNLISLHSVGLVRAGGTFTASYTLFSDVTTPISGTVGGGLQNTVGSAGFVSPAGGDFRLGPTSQAIDAGTDAGIDTDAFGTPRPKGDGFDIGFHEYDPLRQLYLPLVIR
jgi:hypothetical protein